MPTTTPFTPGSDDDSVRAKGGKGLSHGKGNA